MGYVRTSRAAAALISALLLSGPMTQSQTQTQPATAGSRPAPQTQPKQQGAAAQSSDKDAHPQAAPDAPPTQASPAGEQQAKPSSAAQDNPFPEDVSREAAKSAAASSSSSGVSSSSAYDPDVDRGDGDRETNAGRRKLPKPSDNVDVGSLSATARAKQDVQIGNFYLSTGDDKGAYARFADAGKMDPANVDAIFGLAEAARHLQRSEEAIANYKLFLDIEPDGSRAKVARKALRGLDQKK